jgi:hypothetical protein
MRNWRLASGVWWNFDLIEQIFVRQDRKSGFWNIHASLRYKPDDYEENFQLFKTDFDTEDQAMNELLIFMNGQTLPSEDKWR